MLAILIGLGLGLLITAAILWVAIKIVEPSCQRNTPLITLGVSALLTAILFVPVVGWVAAIAVFFILMVKLYDLGIGQTFIVLILQIIAHVGLWKILQHYSPS